MSDTTTPPPASTTTPASQVQRIQQGRQPLQISNLPVTVEQFETIMSLFASQLSGIIGAGTVSGMSLRPDGAGAYFLNAAITGK